MYHSQRANGIIVVKEYLMTKDKNKYNLKRKNKTMLEYLRSILL